SCKRCTTTRQRRIDDMSGKCLFCDKEGLKLSNEHVTPEWLLRYLELPEDDLLFQGIAYSHNRELAAPPRIHSTFNFVQGHICKVNCNGGWMHRLEDDAIPFLKPLMDGQRSINSLSTYARAVVGKWAVKT